MIGDTLDRRNFLTGCWCAVFAVLIIMVMGVVGNTLAADDTTRVAVACVSHGGTWVDKAADCIR